MCCGERDCKDNNDDGDKVPTELPDEMIINGVLYRKATVQPMEEPFEVLAIIHHTDFTELLLYSTLRLDGVKKKDKLYITGVEK